MGEGGDHNPVQQQFAPTFPTQQRSQLNKISPPWQSSLWDWGMCSYHWPTFHFSTSTCCSTPSILNRLFLFLPKGPLALGEFSVFPGHCCSAAVPRRRTW